MANDSTKNIQKESEVNEQDSLPDEQKEDGEAQNGNNSSNNTSLDNEKDKDVLDESIMADTSEQTKSILNQSKSNKQLTYDIKQITIEVIQQIKSDITKLINFVAPKELRDQIRLQINEKVIPFIQHKIIPFVQQHIIPSIKSISVVVKEWGMTTFDMVRRYVGAFISSKMDERDTADDADITAAKEQDTATQN